MTTHQAYFGDIHNHCAIGYGHGTIDDSFQNARMQLDFACVTCHAWWPDLPDNEERLAAVAAYHRNGFAVTAGAWQQVQEVVAANNVPDRFVTFLGHEWHNCAVGDHNVYYRDGVGEILRAATLDEMRATLRRLAPRPGDIVRLPVLMTESDRVPCFLVAQRVPQNVADERRRKLKRKHKEQGFKPPGERYLQLQDWTILVTNLPESEVGNRDLFKWYLMRWRIELIFKACKSHTGMLRIVGHKTNQHHARALVLTWVLAMIILAHRGALAMLPLRQKEGATNSSAPAWEVEGSYLSIFKTTARLFLMLGFQIELAGAGLDLNEHYRRTMIYSSIHNRTEVTPKRKSLGEILESALHLKA